MRQKFQLQNRMDLDAKAKKDDIEALFKRNFKRKITSAKIEKFCWQITIAALMQPHQCDLPCPAAKDNSITHTASTPGNLDAAITMWFAKAELQTTIEVRTRPELSVPVIGRSEHDPNWNERVPHLPAGQVSPSIFWDTFSPAKHSISCTRELSKTHFVRDLPQKVNVEDVKTKLSCETSLKKWKWKIWKRSSRARLPSKSESARCENETVVRDVPQKVKVEDVRTKLSCETSVKKKWKCKMWQRSFRARLPWKSESWMKMWKRSFRARLPSFIHSFIHSINQSN